MIILFLEISDRQRFHFNFSQGYGNIRPYNSRSDQSSRSELGFRTVSGILLTDCRIILTSFWTIIIIIIVIVIVIVIVIIIIIIDIICFFGRKQAI